MGHPSSRAGRGEDGRGARQGGLPSAGRGPREKWRGPTPPPGLLGISRRGDSLLHAGGAKRAQTQLSKEALAHRATLAALDAGHPRRPQVAARVVSAPP